MQSRARHNQLPSSNSAGVVPAVVKVVNVISDIGFGAQKVAKKVSKGAEPLILQSAAQWRKTVDDHIMPNVQDGLAFVGEKAVESVDVFADAVLGSHAKQETAEALKTLHKALVVSEDQLEDPKYDRNEEEKTQKEKSAFLEPPPKENVYPASNYNYEAYHHSPDLIQARREYPNSIRLQTPAQNPNSPFTVEEALYVLGKNIFGKNVTDRLFPVAKTIAKGVGQVGEGLSTFGELLPSVDLENNNPLEFLPPGLVLDEHEYQEQVRVQDEQQGYSSGPDPYGIDLHTRPRNEQSASASDSPRCTTPSGSSGRCTDIQNCPILLADLTALRKSICFKSLFVPGVCCPTKEISGLADVSSQQSLNEGLLPPLQSDYDDFDATAGLQPQGTTKRPQQLAASGIQPPITDTAVQPPLVSLADLPSTTPRPSPLLQTALQTVPGTNQECGSVKIPQSRIVGGNATFEGEQPWMVAIFLHGNSRKEFWCGGALISRHTVITAAHCTKDAKKRPFRPNQFTARVGEWDLSDNDFYSQEFRIVDIKAHPDFKSNGFYNDVALFILDQPVRFTEYIQPICLPSGPLLNQDFTGTLPVVLGWGTTYYGGEEVSKLQGVSLPVWTRSDCDNSYFQPITEVFLCAGFAEGGRDACQGDSGGPLVLYEPNLQRWVLLGIVSFGNRCAEPGYPGVYTRVTHFMPWIVNGII